MRLFHTASVIALSASALAPVAAAAQSTPQQEQLPPAEAADPEYTGVEQIVVTAQRREERLQDVPISISAITGASMERAGVIDTRQLTQVTPGLTFSRANTAFQPYIRGVGTRSSGAGDESNVSVYIDGIYQPSMNGLGLDLINIQRVEVLRGPQGTLFGRNATGGLINIITPDPSYDFSGRVVARYGRFGERQIQGYVTAGIAPGLAIDATGSYYRDHGYIRDLVRGGWMAARQSEVFRTKLLWETGPFRAIASYAYARFDDNSSVTGQAYLGNTVARATNPQPTPFATEPWTASLEVPNLGKSKSDQFALQTRLQLGGVNIETTSALSDGTSLSTTDNDHTPKPIQKTFAPQYAHYLSNEVRILSTGSGPFSWIVGGYQFSGNGGYSALQTSVNGVLGATTLTRMEVKSLAGFGEGTLQLGAVKLIGGLRYTGESRNYTAITGTTTVVPLQKTSFDKLTYRASASYAFNDDANVYASYSRGFKSGVYNTMSTALATATPTRPETIDSFALGAKLDVTPRLRVNVSAFHYDYKDIQQSARDPATALVVLFNAARAKAEGGEIEITARPTPELSLRTYATVLRAKYTSFPGAQIFIPRTSTTPSAPATPTTPALPGPCPVPGASPCGNYSNPFYDASGNDVIRAPRFTAGISGDYVRDLGGGSIGIAGNVYYSGKYYWEFANRVTQPAYVMINGEITWTPDNDLGLKLGLWGRNLANEVVYQQILVSGQADGATFERPRSYGVSASFSF